MYTIDLRVVGHLHVYLRLPLPVHDVNGSREFAFADFM
jgi:hypothetical protein